MAIDGTFIFSCVRYWITVADSGLKALADDYSLPSGMA